MKIAVHQSLCGENSKKAWDLLKTTMAEEKIAKEIAFKCDLHDQTPIGISWFPALRGFVYNDHFLLMKTYIDTSPEVRAGRAFSHVLIISIQDLKFLNNISPLLDVFSKEMNKEIIIEPIIIDVNPIDKYTLNAKLISRFNKVIRGYTEINNFNNTIIWVGQENYEDVACRFWQLLSFHEKLTINFGITFNSSHVSTKNINFITTPEILENKFFRSGYFLIRKNDEHILSGFLEQYLADEPESKKRIDDFLTSIEAIPINTEDIEIIAKGIDTFETIETCTDFKMLISLSHIIAKYSPEENKGIHIKRKLVIRIKSLIYNADAKEIFLVRLFKIGSFFNSENILTESIDEWSNNHLFSLERNKKSDFTILIQDIYKPNNSNWWTKLLSRKIKTFLDKIDDESASIIWMWIQYDFSILNVIKSDISNTKHAEDVFVINFPSSLTTQKLDALKELSIGREWLKLYATILLRKFSYDKALSELLNVDKDINYTAAIEIILKKGKPKGIINFSVDNGDKRLINISGNLCNEDITLLNAIDIENSNWQEIWYEAVKRGNNLIDGIRDPIIKIFQILDNLVNGKPVSENLLTIISESEYANVLEYSGREKLWTKLSNHLKNNFLNRTSSALLGCLSKDSTYDVPEDQILLDYIISSDAITHFLYYNRSNIKSVLPIFKTFKTLPEYIVSDYVDYYNGPVDIIDATQLGKFVLERDYGKTAHVIYKKCEHIINFKLALVECYSLLDFITKAKIKLSGILTNVIITEDQWWEEFTKITIKLYPEGPTDEKIWLQSDGEESDLLVKGSGKEIWIHALNKLRNGSCSGITVNKLLKKMGKEYPRNNVLLTLKELFKIL